MLKHLKKVYVQFAPGDPRSVSARELLQRVSADRAKKSNPGCKIEFKIDEDTVHGKSFVELEFTDNEKRQILTADYRVVDITKMIDQKGQEMEMKGVLKELGGFDPWRPENRLKGEQTKAPSAASVPRPALKS